MVVDTQGIMELVSAPFAELLGYATHELLGRNLAMLMPPSLAAMHGGFIRGATANGSTVKEVRDAVMQKSSHYEVYSVSIIKREGCDGLTKDVVERHYTICNALEGSRRHHSLAVIISL